MRTGFIGLGSQGAPMARRIVEAGHFLSIWARRPETLESFADTPVDIGTSPADVARKCEIICICVVDGKDVEDVVLGDDGVLAGIPGGGIIAIHSTIHPETCRGLAAQALTRGVHVIDAPVSGGAPAAKQARLLVMVGGDSEAFERARPMMEAFGNPILHLGPVGSGQTAKLLNNFIFTAQLALAMETMQLSGQLGMDVPVMLEVLANGSGGSQGMAILASTGFDIESLRIVAPLLAKDVRILTEVAGDVGVVTPPYLDALAQTALWTLGSSAAMPSTDGSR